MKIVVAGAAAVGTHLAKLLAKEEHDVVLMDDDANRINQHTFMNMMTMIGSPTSIKALKEAGVPDCDLFIATTQEQSQNIHACILATSLGARRTMARIDNNELISTQESRDFYSRIGISMMVYPEQLGGQEAAAAIIKPWVRMNFDLCDGHLKLLSVKLHDKAPIIGQSMIDIGKAKHNFHIAAIGRGDEVIIPNGQDVVQAGDIVYFITVPDKLDVIRMICGREEIKLKRLIFIGSTRMGIQTTYRLPHDYEIIFIESDPHETEHIMEKVPHAIVQMGNESIVETLTDLHLNKHDAVLAFGPNSDSNILACLTAKKLGVGKTVVEVGDIEYIKMAAQLNIDSCINKKTLTASSIYQLLLDADKTNAKCCSLIDAEAADLVAQPNSEITRKSVLELKLPKGITLGGLVRNGVGTTITGQTRIQAGDHVVVVCMDDLFPKVEKLFL